VAAKTYKGKSRLREHCIDATLIAMLQYLPDGVFIEMSRYAGEEKEHKAPE